jgi:acetyl esterase
MFKDFCASVVSAHNAEQTLVVQVSTAEAEMSRTAGEPYANKRREAGVPLTAVRFLGILRDFVLLHALERSTAPAPHPRAWSPWLRTE